MKNKIQPTSNERIMRDNDFIVSKTDLKGRITYANKIFIEFSAYTQNELINSQQNIVRHPEMPRGVFSLLWETISSGKEFNAYIKNMAKDGSYYWVFANVTPSYDANNNIIGYYSVRRKPSQNALNIIMPVYKEMLEAEKQMGSKDAIAASTKILFDKLDTQGVIYDQFILSI